MADFSWLGEMEDLTAASLTLRAQTIDPDDVDQLVHDVFFPRRDVDSISFAEINDVDFRPVSDRREWNQRGRVIPLKTPPSREFEMVPIESTFKLEEYEIQRLLERTLGNESLFQQIVGASIPDRVDKLVEANFRRMEIEAMEAWALGQVTAMNPQTGTTQVLDYGYDTNRYTTAATAWNDTGVNAYDELLSWLETGLEYVGGFSGIVLRLATYKEIQKDAPNSFIPDSALGIQVTRAQLESRIQEDLGQPFRFYILEHSMDIFDDGGLAYTRTKVWPAQYVAMVPPGTSVGNMSYAPVSRAMELARQVPGAGVNIRGNTVYYDEAGAGRDLTIECQVNAMPVPNEQNVWVIDAGV
jgi:hypothetical protein